MDGDLILAAYPSCNLRALDFFHRSVKWLFILTFGILETLIISLPDTFLWPLYQIILGLLMTSCCHYILLRKDTWLSCLFWQYSRQKRTTKYICYIQIWIWVFVISGIAIYKNLLIILFRGIASVKQSCSLIMYLPWHLLICIIILHFYLKQAFLIYA